MVDSDAKTRCMLFLLFKSAQLHPFLITFLFSSSYSYDSKLLWRCVDALPDAEKMYGFTR